jgi:hypothetical protein
MHNQYVEVRNKEKQTIKHLILTWHGLLQAFWVKILKPLNTGLMMSTFLSFNKIWNGQAQQKESLIETQRGCNCNNMWSMASLISRERRQKKTTCQTQKKRGQQKSKKK